LGCQYKLLVANVFVFVPRTILVSFVNGSCLFGASPLSIFSFAHLPFLRASLDAVAGGGGLSVTKHIYIHIHPNRLENLRLFGSVFINRHTLDPTHLTTMRQTGGRFHVPHSSRYLPSSVCVS
jgi:hypothetical protein